MKNFHKKSTLSIFLSIFAAVGLFGQTISFDVDFDQGCAPLTVQFTNTSDTVTGVTFEWDFNDGTGIHYVLDTSITFQQPGQYNVYLNAYDGSQGYLGGDYKTINVQGSSGTFNVDPDTAGCLGEEMEFYTNDPYNWVTWIFGDGSDTAEHNWARHTYSDTGTYTVTMIIETAMCGTDTVRRNVVIKNAVTPVIQINTDGGNTEFCPNDQVYFGVSYENYASYHWYFGDGDSSTQTRPYHVYADTGTYQVILKVTNACGNVNYDTLQIEIKNGLEVYAGFHFWPDPACPNDFVNFYTWVSAASYHWDFGNGGTSILRDNRYAYPDTGNYNVQLIATNGCGDSDTAYRNVHVQYQPWNKPSAEIYFDDERYEVDTITICPGQKVWFDNNSWDNNRASLSYFWNFGDGNTLLTTDRNEVSNTYDSTGVFEVFLIVTNPCGGKDTSNSKWVIVDPNRTPDTNLVVVPSVAFGGHNKICPGEQAFFFDEDNWENRKNYIYSIWYGDGDSLVNFTESTDTLIGVLASHTYQNTGTYNYTFTAKNTCGNTYTLNGTIVVDTSKATEPFYYISNSTSSENSQDDRSGCSGDYVEFQIIGGVSYIWYFGDGTPGGDTNQFAYHVYADTGTYNAFCIATNACGRTDTLYTEVKISNNNKPYGWFDVDKENACVNDTINFEYNEGDDGIDNNTYLWNFGDGNISLLRTPSHMYASSGQYNVKLTVTNGCGSTTEERTVWVNQPMVYLGSDIEFCTGGSATINPGNIYSTYAWSTGATSNTITVNTSGTYMLTVTDNFGCTNSDTVQATTKSAQANAGNDQTICLGNQANLTATGGVSYLWSTAHATASITVSPTVTTTYTVTVTDADGCTGTDDVVVAVDVANANAGPDVSICTGGSVTLTATGGVSYQWNTGPITAQITVSPTTATTYTVTVTNANSCIDVDTVVVTIGTSITADAGLDVDICKGESTTLTVSGGVNYVWSPAAGLSATNIANPVASPTITTTYTVNVNDGTACTGTDSVVVTVHSLPVVNVTSDTSICAQDSLVLNAGTGFVSYQWSTSATTSSITVDSAGVGLGLTTYYVTVTDNNGCQAIDSANVTFVICTGIDNTVANNLVINIFPNPSTGIFKIDITGLNSETELNVLNIFGQLIYKEILLETKSAHYTKELDLSAYANGIYFVRLKGKNVNLVKKIIIN